MYVIEELKLVFYPCFVFLQLYFVSYIDLLFYTSLGNVILSQVGYNIFHKY